MIPGTARDLFTENPFEPPDEFESVPLSRQNSGDHFENLTSYALDPFGSASVSQSLTTNPSAVSISSPSDFLRPTHTSFQGSQLSLSALSVPSTTSETKSFNSHFATFFSALPSTSTTTALSLRSAVASSSAPITPFGYDEKAPQAVPIPIKEAQSRNSSPFSVSPTRTIVQGSAAGIFTALTTSSQSTVHSETKEKAPFVRTVPTSAFKPYFGGSSLEIKSAPMDGVEFKDLAVPEELITKIQKLLRQQNFRVAFQEISNSLEKFQDNEKALDILLALQFSLKIRLIERKKERPGDNDQIAILRRIEQNEIRYEPSVYDQLARLRI